MLAILLILQNLSMKKLLSSSATAPKQSPPFHGDCFGESTSPRNDVQCLSPRGRSHKDNLIILLQLCFRSIKLAQVNAIYKNIKMTTQVVIGIEQMRLESWILRKHILDQFID